MLQLQLQEPGEGKESETETIVETMMVCIRTFKMTGSTRYEGPQFPSFPLAIKLSPRQA